MVRATFLPQAPAAMALGAAGDCALAHAVGAGVARGIGSLGFNWNFAPVLDVNNNPANPVIAERSFSADPSEVARLGGAWMRGRNRRRRRLLHQAFPRSWRHLRRLACRSADRRQAATRARCARAAAVSRAVQRSAGGDDGTHPLSANRRCTSGDAVARAGSAICCAPRGATTAS